jgi:hypothetical protein
MLRGTKEFYDIQHSFEKAVDSGELGYITSDFTKDTSSKFSFYANGAVNQAFRAYIAGYAVAKSLYQ